MLSDFSAWTPVCFGRTNDLSFFFHVFQNENENTIRRFIFNRRDKDQQRKNLQSMPG